MCCQIRFSNYIPFINIVVICTNSQISFLTLISFSITILNEILFLSCDKIASNLNNQRWQINKIYLSY